MDPIALYIHWPFCLAKCPYCDFNSHVREHLPQKRFREALRAELAWEAGRLGPRPLASVFFGGGTPSLMEPETVVALLEDAARLFPPYQRRTGAACGLPRGRGQPLVAWCAEPGC